MHVRTLWESVLPQLPWNSNEAVEIGIANLHLIVLLVFFCDEFQLLQYLWKLEWLWHLLFKQFPAGQKHLHVNVRQVYRFWFVLLILPLSLLNNMQNSLFVILDWHLSGPSKLLIPELLNGVWRDLLHQLECEHDWMEFKSLFAD